MSDITQSLVDFMHSDGIHPSEELIHDGLFKRIDDCNGKPGNELIGYVSFGTAGYYCHWSKMPDGRTWSIKREVEFTQEERLQYAKQMQQARKDKESADDLRRKECRLQSMEKWSGLPLADDTHPVLVRKGVKANGARVDQGKIVVPVCDANHVIHGLQYIPLEGKKLFESGTAVKSHFGFISGDCNLPIYICESFTTAGSISLATGANVFYTFGCGNLLPVAEVIREKSGKEQAIVICADDDRLTAGNPGLTHATTSATAINASLAIPFFPGDLGTDFNDMAALCGIEKVKSYLESVTSVTAPKVDDNKQQYELRDYQNRALTEIKQAIVDGHHCIMVQSPTGSGKGVMLSHIIKLCHQRGSSVLFLVHRQEILFQISTYLNRHGIDHGIIKSGEQHEDWHPVQLASFQTILRRIKNPYIKSADVIIVDEAHHATAETYKRVIDHFKKKVVLGFSATPSRQSGQGLGNMFDKMISVATIKELTDLKYLAPVRVFAPVRPDLTGVKVTAGEYNTKQLESAMNKASLVGNIVGHYQKYGENRKAVVFATGVDHSIALRQQFLSEGITSAHLDGTTPKEEREDILNRFKSGSIQVIVNCMILTEGVDVPDIGCVILARPTKSLPMYLQMVGRGMRSIPGKTDCILLDHAGAVHEHGFPDEVSDWELSTTSKTVNKRQEQRKKKDSEPISCPVCDLLYTTQLQCPGCGNIPTVAQIGKDIEYIDGELGEIVRKSDKRPKEPSGEAKASWYRQLKLYASERGFQPGWVSHTFKDKFGVWPNKYNGLSAAPAVSQEVIGFIRHKHIRRAKSSETAW